MARYLEQYASVEALQYDGTRESALAIAKAFPGKIARDLARDDVLLALACDGFDHEQLREVPTGAWLYRRLMSGRLHLERDELFAPYHTRLDL